MARKKSLSKLKQEIISILSKVSESFNNPNLFSILNLETKELIHSRFIAYLLSPHGNLKSGSFEKSIDCPSHNYEKKLTSKLLKSWGIDFDGSCNVDVCIEYEDANLEGRIDILIKVGTKLIAIENKIYAEDEEFQLKRYYDFLKKQKDSKKSDVNKIELIYLTLDGRKASSKATGNNQINYKQLSYKAIWESLDKCINIVEEKDPLLSYISEYQNVINKLKLDYDIASKIIENDNWKYINTILEDEELKESVKESLNKFVYPYLIENVIKQNLIKLDIKIKENDLYPENNNLYMWIKTDGKKEYDIFFTIEDGIIKYFPIFIDSSGQKPKWYCGNKKNWVSWASRKHWNKNPLKIEVFFKKNDEIKKDINEMIAFIKRSPPLREGR